ncbi:hypothetical protein QTP70_027738 [Hemibagrus guttatus]|uniref:Cytoplasmic dynein 1 intermediate chain 2 n=1 Tax=Hemibagrus guttatus TaxID=175788 RepID=A0AAE0VDM7_9TELE|nr:hypothetical protein QTP70_027738 [Hemibagrus guttatus]
MSDKSELKAELERKKQRLAQIREEKKRKEEERKKKETEGRVEGASPPNDDSDLERKRRETEALLQSMGITDPAMVPPPMSPSAKSVGTPSETGSQDSVDGTAGASPSEGGVASNLSVPVKEAWPLYLSDPVKEAWPL